MIHLGGYCTAGVVLVGADGSLAQKDNANLSLSKQNYERNRIFCMRSFSINSCQIHIESETSI